MDSSSTQHHLYFIYDDSNQPYAVLHQTGTGAPTLYYYMLNVQGDVIGLMDSDAEIVANYQYDPWGAVLSCTGSKASTIGAMNPLRYRGYYYDTETGFYYLQSRYYDPALGRFINADSYSTTDTQGFLSYNMFAYCENDPVMCGDADGEWLHIVVGAFVGVACQVVSDVIAIHTGEQKKGSSLAVYVGAALGGALAASGVPLPIAVECSTAISMSVYIGDAMCQKEYDSISIAGAAEAAFFGATSGLIGGAGAPGKTIQKTIVSSVKRYCKTGAKKYYKVFRRRAGQALKASGRLLAANLWGNSKKMFRSRIRHQVKRFKKWFWNGSR